MLKLNRDLCWAQRGGFQPPSLVKLYMY